MTTATMNNIDALAAKRGELAAPETLADAHRNTYGLESLLPNTQTEAQSHRVIPGCSPWTPAAPPSSNPKDALGIKKPPTLSVVPTTAILILGAAMANGAGKYGRFNWRTKKVLASIYIDAAMRHIMAWTDCQEIAEDSKVHHLGHAMACFAIVLDAQVCGALLDDRIPGGATAEMIAEWEANGHYDHELLAAPTIH